MSLRDTEPVPGRMVGMLHTALVLASAQDDFCVDKKRFDQLVAPNRANRTVCDIIFGECVFWGFFTRQEGTIFSVNQEFTHLAQEKIGRTISSERFVYETLAPAVRHYVLQKLRSQNEGGVFFDAPFSRMLAWILMQNGSTFPLTKQKTETLSADQDSSKFLGWTMTRHEGFVHWAQFLGFQHHHSVDNKPAYQPDPTRALYDAIDHWLPEDSITIVQALTHLESVYPWLEQGAIAEQTRKGLSQPPLQKENEITPALSLALRRLERDGAIQLQHLSDANLRTLSWAGRRDTVSHIVRKKGTKGVA